MCYIIEDLLFTDKYKHIHSGVWAVVPYGDSFWAELAKWLINEARDAAWHRFFRHSEKCNNKNAEYTYGIPHC